MAAGVNTVKSGAITNRDSTPKKLSNSNLIGAKLIEAIGVCEVGATDSTGSKYKFCQIPSNARISTVLLYQDVLNGGASTQAVDIGLYDTTENGGVVVDADFFASAVVGSASAVNALDVTHEAANALDISLAEDMIWQALGLSSDPCKMYDVVATSTGDADAGGTMMLKVRYTR